VTFIHTATAGDASELLIVSGNDQTAAVGTRLPADLVVRLVDGAGNGVPGAAVTWLVGAGDGTVTPENGTTDDAGRASAQWTLGPNPVDNRVDAVVSGVGIANFRATATAGAPAALSLRTQPSSSARNGVPLQRQPVVQIRDNQGDDVATPGVEVTAQLSGGGGELLGTRLIRTDAAGRATFTDLAIAGAEGRRTIAFTASGYAGVASNEIDVRPISTSTTITSDLPDPSVTGTTFTVGFQVTSGGPTPTGSVAVTVSGGTLSCTGTLQGGAGSCQLTLNVVGVSTLTATYAGAAGLERSSGTARHEVTAVTPQNRAPSADYDWHCDGLTCQFTDKSNDPDGQVTGWTWNFGDGSPTSGVKDPTHTYLAPGDYTVSLTAMDNGGATDQKSATIRVNAPPPNKPPQADFDLSCPDLTCTFTDKSKDDDGVIVSRSWNYGDGSPASDVPSHTYASEGKYQVTLTVTDDDGASSTKTRDANPKAPPPPPNTPPTAGDDAVTTDEDASVTIAVLANDNDPDGDVLTPQIAHQPEDGTATVNGDRSVTYTPNSNFSGSDSFTYRATDGRGGTSNEATVRITVNAVDDPPVAQNDGPYSTPGADQALTVSAADGVLSNDSDVDGPGLTAQNPSVPTKGSVELGANGSFTYTPAAGESGDDSFTYEASDGTLTSTATVTISISP
jgi:PKD repeat protein